MNTKHILCGQFVLDNSPKFSHGFMVWDDNSGSVIIVSADTAEQLADEYCADVEYYAPYFDLEVGETFDRNHSEIVTRIW